METGPRFDDYAWRGGHEALLRFGPGHGPTVLAALPLFEEGNRCRAAMVDVLRRLAARGIAGALAELPGTGDSLVATVDATLADGRDAFAAAAAALPGPVHVLAWRGGALVDGAAAVASRWYLAPATGEQVVRELRRVRQMSGERDTYAGNLISDTMIAELAAAAPMTLGRVRIARLESDARTADVKLPGAALWRAAEPGTGATLQQAVADDVAEWIAACAGN